MHSKTLLFSVVFFILIFSSTFLLYSNLNKCSSDLNSYSVMTSKKQNEFLIVIILSSSLNTNRRNVLRQTWLQTCRENNIKYFFVIGTKNVDQHLKESINDEYNSFQDVLRMENVLDSYKELTSKTLEAFVWLNKNIKFKYVLKCDDDSFVHVLKLVRLLEEYTEDEKQLYLGFFNGHARVQKSGKWKESNWVLCDFYLPYALGGGYVLDEGLVKFIAKNSKDLELYVSEDVSVGSWLATNRHINRVHSYRFNTEISSRGCSNSYVVSHKHTDTELKNLYNNLREFGKMCKEELKIRSSYNYNWTVPPSKCCQRTDQLP